MSSRVSRRRFLNQTLGITGAWALGAECVRAKEADPVHECSRRMGLLWEAIQRWKRAHGPAAWPSDLAVLRQEGFLTDPRAWICPVSEKSGDFRFAPRDPIVLSASQFNRESNYQYEFSAKLVDPGDIGELGPMTMRESKAALAATEIGERVPVLRCMSHGDQSINLSLDGRTYLSPLYWEYLFSEIRPEPYTMPWMVARHPGKPGETRTLRSPRLPMECLDLEAVANATPDLPWLDGKPKGFTLEAFVRQTESGMALKPHPFDARRLVQTTGLDVSYADYEAGFGFPGRAYPAASRLLSLAGRRARRIVVLWATAFRERESVPDPAVPRAQPGKVVGELRVQRQGHAPVHAPLVYGKNIGFWRDAATASTSAIAWRESAAADSPVLYRAEIEVASEGAPVVLQAIQLHADLQSSASPFLAGITLEP